MGQILLFGLVIYKCLSIGLIQFDFESWSTFDPLFQPINMVLE